MDEAVRRYAARSTAASAALEGRVIPPGFVRSAAVERFLAARRLSGMPGDVTTDSAFDPGEKLPDIPAEMADLYRGRLAELAEQARVLGRPDPADDGPEVRHPGSTDSPLFDASLEPDELAELTKDIDPKLLAKARRMQDAYVARIKAAGRGLWAPTLAEPLDGTRLEFEVDTDLYAFRRDDTSSAHAGYPYGDGGVTWLEYGRSVPVSWAVMCATYGQDVLANAVRLLAHPEDAHKALGWKSNVYLRGTLAAAAERERKAARDE